ncbi:hypothetical protein M434DRAFT_33326 [Hypoxylon sp. CO27-5]|nr:hypothetical protein M434DRAFT_33326 [Hypoxylon sp. CO27-5]
MWRPDLSGSLLWYEPHDISEDSPVKFENSEAEYLAPSWSWASVEHPISFRDLTFGTPGDSKIACLGHQNSNDAKVPRPLRRSTRWISTSPSTYLQSSPQRRQRLQLVQAERIDQFDYGPISGVVLWWVEGRGCYVRRGIFAVYMLRLDQSSKLADTFGRPSYAISEDEYLNVDEGENYIIDIL